MNNNPRLVALAAVVGLLIVSIAVVFIAAGGDDEAAAAFERAELVEWDGTPLPALADPDPAIGMQSPIVSTITADGDPAQLGEPGTPTVIGFVAHWCPHCQEELPQLVDWVADGRADGVDVTLVSTAVDENADNHPPSAWIAREEWTGTVLLDDIQRTGAAVFGLTGFPYWVALDADGVVVARAAGQIGPDAFSSLVDAALG